MTRVSEDELDWTETDRGETRFRRKQLAEAAGGGGIGCSLYELPAGAKSWPYHYHAANEEALYVLAGEATLRHDGETRAVEAGDYVAFAADASGAHRVVNEGDEPVRYLALSTMTEPDVTVYPDSETFGVYVGSPPGGREDRSLEGYYETDGDIDYWGM